VGEQLCCSVLQCVAVCCSRLGEGNDGCRNLIQSICVVIGVIGIKNVLQCVAAGKSEGRAFFVKFPPARVCQN